MAFDACGLDAGYLYRTHDGCSGKTGARQTGNGHVAWPRRVVGTGNHGHPDQPEWREPPAGNNQRRAPLFRQTVGIGKRHNDNVEGVEAIFSTRRTGADLREGTGRRVIE